MRIAGIIAEYDPFHNGHAAHIMATKATDGGNATHIVAVMSGSFTQRGEPALLSKFHRTEMALQSGADLVIELPLPWAMAPAENFAAGGVAILAALGCVDLISFGSECGDVKALRQLAGLSDMADYRAELQKQLSNGIPYAAAAQAAAATILGENTASALASPNNTLGIEYLRAVQSQNVSIDAYTLSRQGAKHNDAVACENIASASYIRQLIRQGKTADATAYMPTKAAHLLLQSIQSQHAPIYSEKIETVIPAILRRMSEDDFSKLPWLSEGLENRLYKAGRCANSYADLLNAVNTKRYPAARLRRMVWSAVLGMTSQDIKGLPPYIRVLGMNSRGREILATASPTLPILTKPSQLKELDDYANRVFQLETIATDIHALGMPQPLPCGTDYTNKLIVI